MHLLHVTLCILLQVLGQTFLDALLELLDDISASVADAHLGLLALLAALLGKLLTALLCQRRNAQADNLAIVLGRNAYVAVHDSLLDGTEHILVPRLDGNSACIRRIDGCHLIQRNHAAIAVNTNAVKDLHICFTSTNMCQSLLEVHHGLFHFLLSLAEDFLYFYHILFFLIIYNVH